MTDPNQIALNVAQVRATMDAACLRASRTPDEVTLIAVSKTHPVAALVAAAQAGIAHFGENRVEEAETKIPQVKAAVAVPPTWHMIGHVQSRKVKHVLPLFDVVHSVDSLKLAQKFATLAQERGQMGRILLEINVSGETSKEGVPAAQWETDAAVRADVFATVQAILNLEHLEMRGLMTMAPYEAEAEETRPVFRSLARLRDALRQQFGAALPDLSMGMTNDYAVAIEEGATLVRVGRAIFGERA